MSFYDRLVKKEEKLSLVGLGYVGMPIAVAFANKGIDVIGFDLNKAKIEIQIVTPYLHIAQIKRFLSLIPDGVKTTIITGNEESFKPDTWVKIQSAIDLLRQNQVQVICSPKVYQRYAVIDRQLVWYGGINYLGFEKAAQGAMRLSSTELAKELLIHPSSKS